MLEKSDILVEAGLTNWEARAFRALIGLGETTTGPLVDKSGIPQSKIYSVLESLKKKGLVSYAVKGKIKHFQASEPEKLYLIFKQKEEAIRNEVDKLKELKSLQKEESSVEIFEGLKSIRLLNSEIVAGAKKDEEFYGYSEGIYPDEVNELYHRFGELRRIAGMKDHLLITISNKELFEKSIHDQPEYVREKTRYCEVQFPQDTAIFRSQVIIYSWGSPAKAILIKDAEIAKNYKEFFLDLWNNSE